MFKNYIQTALRSIRKNKLYAAINIFGLAIGMAICILVFLFIREELSYDQWWEDVDQMYRVTGLFTQEENEEWLALTPFPIARIVQDELPEVKAATKLNDAWNERLFEYDGYRFYSKSYAFVDTAFFDVFSFAFLSGNPATVLQDPNNIVLSQKMAEQIFGKANPMGQSIQFNSKKEYVVAGVLEAPIGPSHFEYDFYFPWHRTMDDLNDSEWVSMFNYYTYTKLHAGVDPLAFTEKMNQLFRSKLKGLQQKNGVADMNSADAQAYRESVRFGIQPVKDIHLRSHLDGEINPNGQLRYIYIYALVAFIMLLVACINFMNMATARSANRAKEVGVRKVIGASRWQTSLQFLTESMVQSFIALLLAFLLAEFMLPSFNLLLEKDLSIFQSGAYSIFGFVLCFALFTGLLAGSYPAFFLSAFQPIKVLKGDFSRSKESAPLRKGLVIFQF
ncbi:MAG: ABC transporter permease, partial [Bacteroidota bacterium]